MFIHTNVCTQTYTYTHIFTHTKRNCSIYAAETEVLTKITNKWRAQKIKVSHCKKTNTKPGAWLPSSNNNTYNCLLRLRSVPSVSLHTPPAEIQWGQGMFYQESFVRFGDRKTVRTVTLVPGLVYSTQPGISWEGHPRAACAQSCGCSHPTLLQQHHPTFSSFNASLRSVGWSTKDSNNHFLPQSLGQNKKGDN